MSQIKSHLFKIFVSFLSLMLSIFVLEIVARIVGPQYYKFNNRSQEYYTNPRGYYSILRREGKDTIYGLEYYSTREGYRHPFLKNRVPLQNSQIPILGLGDSFAYGRGVKYEDIYLTRLEKLLKTKIKNTARVGADIEHIYNIYITESSRIPPGHLVIYGFVLNDFGVLTDSIIGSDFIDINNGGNQFNIWRKRSSLINFIFYCIEKKRLHNVTLKGYLDAFEGNNARTNFHILERLNQSVIANKSKLVVVLFPLLYDFPHYKLKDIHRKIRLFCKERKILFLDLLPAFSRYRTEELWAHPTDHHPNEIAHEIAAEELYTFLKKKNTIPSLIAEKE